jgi:hypothetical protein
MCTGLDMLRGFSIDSAAIVLPAESDGTNLAGFATLPNYSIVTFGLVRTYFSIHKRLANFLFRAMLRST